MKRIWKGLFCGKASGRMAEAGSVEKNRAAEGSSGAKDSRRTETMCGICETIKHKTAEKTRRQAAGTLAKAAALTAGMAVMMWDLGGHHCPGGTERSLYHIQL